LRFLPLILRQSGSYHFRNAFYQDGESLSHFFLSVFAFATPTDFFEQLIVDLSNGNLEQFIHPIDVGLLDLLKVDRLIGHLNPANVNFTMMILKRPRPRSSWSNST
jgi:hypothetical protein